MDWEEFSDLIQLKANKEVYTKCKNTFTETSHTANQT